MCQPKDQGGLGVLDLEVMNIALLAKWLWKLFNEKGMWQTLLQNKYLRNTTFGQCSSKNGDSHFWQGLMEIKPLFLSCCKFKIGNGAKTRFWEDNWFSDTCFVVQFPRLYAVSNNQNITIQKVFCDGINSLNFRRNLVGIKLEEWNKLKNCCETMILTEEDDTLVWMLSSSKQYTVKSFYSAMHNVGKVPYRFMWKVKIPLRIKIFIWLMLKKSILTRDVLRRRGGVCDKNCLFCGQEESINHLFFSCPLARYVWNCVSVATGLKCHFSDARFCLTSWLNGFSDKLRKQIMVGVAAVIWTLWKTRNLACFERKWPSEPLEVVRTVCFWIDWWANMQVSEDAKLDLHMGAKLLVQIGRASCRERVYVLV